VVFVGLELDILIRRELFTGRISRGKDGIIVEPSNVFLEYFGCLQDVGMKPREVRE